MIFILRKRQVCLLCLTSGLVQARKALDAVQMDVANKQLHASSLDQSIEEMRHQLLEKHQGLLEAKSRLQAAQGRQMTTTNLEAREKELEVTFVCCRSVELIKPFFAHMHTV